MSTTHTHVIGGPPNVAWEEVHESEDFQELRGRLRRFIFPVTALFLAWYLLYVVVADYAHEFMSTKLFGNITVGLVFGLLQFASTFVITWLYMRYANRRLDPIAEKIRADVERESA